VFSVEALGAYIAAATGNAENNDVEVSA
jgi:hypothetical protein